MMCQDIRILSHASELRARPSLAQNFEINIQIYKREITTICILKSQLLFGRTPRTLHSLANSPDPFSTSKVS